MRYLTTTLLAVLLVLPTAWAEPPEEEDKNKQVEISIQAEIGDEATEEPDPIDQLIERMAGKLDAEDQLSAEEKAQIKQEVRKALENLSDVRVGRGEGFMAMVIGLITVILIFGGPIIIVGIALYSSYRKRRLTHDTINKYVESGKDIPAEVLDGLHRQTHPKGNLHKGLVMVGVGLGIFLCFLIFGSPEVGALGLIPLFIGLAQLLVWKLEKRKQNGLEH